MTDDPLIREGQILQSPLFNEPMRVETVKEHDNNTWVLGLVGKNTEQFRKVTLTKKDL